MIGGKKMKKSLYGILFLALIVGVLGIKIPQTQAKQMNLSADSAILMDVDSGAILYEKNMDKKQYPASITKILTTLVALENSTMSETVTYSSRALQLESGASNIEVKAGEKLSMKDSLYAIMLMSANECCNGVAEHIAGNIENYVAMMNEKAKELGCTGTHFANTNGLWMEDHYTTAHDMAIIARAAYKNPVFAEITGTKKYQIGPTNKAKNGHYLHNHHGMLLANSSFPQYEYKYCVGGKTGYTSKCRYTLVTFGKKDGMTLVSVVMRAENPWTEPNEYTDSTKLLNYGFNNYKHYDVSNEAKELINKDYLFTSFNAYYNKATSPVSVDESAGVILKKGVSLDQAERSVQYYDEPQTSEDGRKVIGKITYTYKGSEVGGSNIYYEKPNLSTLNDSVDISKWYDDAVEKASKPKVNWKKISLIVILIVVVLFAVFYLFNYIKSERDQRIRRNRYKRTRRKSKDNQDGIYYRKR